MEALEAYGWRRDPSVEEGLFAEGHRFDFFQAVRLLECLYADRHPPAASVEPAREAVRFTSRVDLGFAASDVDAIEPPESEGQPARMAVNFLGLAGAMGPLPRAITELILERVDRKDTAFRDFLDVFNHRLVSILYRARKKYRTSLHWRSPEESPPIRPAEALVGLGTGHLGGRLHVQDRALLLYTGLLSRRAPTMVGLARMLEHYFGCGVEIRPHLGRWHRLSDDQLTVLGTGGRNRRLGESAVLGGRVWDQSAGFELRVGPLGFDRFRDFLPEQAPRGRGFRTLCALAEFYAGDDFLYRVRLVLEAAELPALVLGGERPARLGWTSWLKTREFPADDSQVALEPGIRPWLAS